jgi:hypothetical protein
MKSSVRFHAAVCAAALLLVPWQGFATDPASGSGKNCDSVAEAVRAAVEKEPQKVLLFIEDFMVANEGCAAAIVTAAIEASKANADLAKQIAATATHVAPQMGPVIADAVAKLIPDQAAAVVAVTQKEEGNTPTNPEVSTGTTDTSSSSDDDLKLPIDIRGVYFIEPIGTGGTIASQTSSNASGKTKTATHGGTHTVVQNTVSNHAPNHPSPVSPSSGSP